MDRFIANSQSHFLIILENLKSNMDRFIELKATRQLLTRKHLKSNMDRFIAIHYNSEIYDYMI